MSQSEQAFTGRLITALADYNPRQGQIDMAEAIEKVIEDKTHLVVEAGTGTGKTFAYLVPCLLSNKKTLVSTGTKTLQDQLFHKDLPLLIKALGISANIQLLKGRSNYLCRYRIELNSVQGDFFSKQAATEFNLIRQALPRVVSGDISELSEISEDSTVWPSVTSTADNCLGAECDYFDDCYLVKARRRAMKADVLVINHHLYFSDNLIKQEGFGELLPGVDAIVFDEAHQLPELASQFYGQRLSSRQFSELFRDISALVKISNEDQHIVDVTNSVDSLIGKFQRSITGLDSRYSWSELIQNSQTQQRFEFMLNGLTELHGVITKVCEHNDEFDAPLQRLQGFIDMLQQFNDSDNDCILWLEVYKSSFILHSTPLSVADSFSFHLNQSGACAVFTSATLAVDGQYHHFTKPLGLEQIESLTVESPFDYQQQALLYMPRGLPDVKDKRFTESLIEAVLPIISELQGRSFLLFTSYSALNQAAKLLEMSDEFNLLVQGRESNRVLLQRFKQSDNALLLGTASFWEGVDIKGQDLSCVVIDKLPFGSPGDPVTKAKIQLLKRQGIQAFDHFQMPQAIVSLKQGVGRLIRGEEDKGILVIGDPRLYGRAYGKRFFASLPRMNLTRTLQTVLEFVKNM